MPFSLYIYMSSTNTKLTAGRMSSPGRRRRRPARPIGWYPKCSTKDATREVKFGDRRKGVSPQSGREDELSRSWRAHPTFFLCSLSCHVESDFTRLPVVSNLQGQRQTPG